MIKDKDIRTRFWVRRSERIGSPPVTVRAFSVEDAAQRLVRRVHGPDLFAARLTGAWRKKGLWQAMRLKPLVEGLEIAVEAIGTPFLIEIPARSGEPRFRRKTLAEDFVLTGGKHAVKSSSALKRQESTNSGPYLPFGAGFESADMCDESGREAERPVHSRPDGNDPRAGLLDTQ